MNGSQARKVSHEEANRLEWARKERRSKPMGSMQKSENESQQAQSARLDCNDSCVCISALRFSLLFFFLVQPAIVDFVNYEQCIRALFTIPQIILSATFLLKMGPTILFTHLKIISLQCFQFQFSISAKINSIQTHPLSKIFQEDAE